MFDKILSDNAVDYRTLKFINLHGSSIYVRVYNIFQTMYMHQSSIICYEIICGIYIHL